MADTHTTLINETVGVKTHTPRLSKRRKQCFKAMAFFMVMALALSFSMALLVTRWLLPTTVTFDMAQTVNSFQQQMASQFNAETPLSEEQIAAATHRFQIALSDSLSDYQQAHRAVILVSPAVVMGADDITVDIQSAIADKMAQ